MASTRVTDLVRGVLLRLGRSSGVFVLENDKFNVRATDVLTGHRALEEHGVPALIERIGHGRARHASEGLGRHVVVGRGMNLDSLLPVRKRIERDRVARKVVHGLLFPRDAVVRRFVLGLVRVHARLVSRVLGGRIAVVVVAAAVDVAVPCIPPQPVVAVAVQIAHITVAAVPVVVVTIPTISSDSNDSTLVSSSHRVRGIPVIGVNRAPPMPSVLIVITILKT